MDDNRASYLATLPQGDLFTPCRCSKVPGYTYISDRDMWLCATCLNPAGGHRGYSPFCIFCGDPFTLDKYEKLQYPQCPNCVG